MASFCKKLVLLLMLLVLMFPLPAAAQETAGLPMQAAFVRNGQLWLKINEKETKLTKSPDGNVSNPSWSHDGRWISYLLKDHLWVYDRIKNQHTQLTSQDRNVRNAQWAPNKNIVAFQVGDAELAMADLQGGTPKSVQYVSNDVNQFTWLPDGSGFLSSSSATPMEEGWTRPALYKIPLSAIGSGGITAGSRFFTLPSMITKGNLDILAIGTSTFKWSPDGQWVAFIVHPTASWAADSNMLCVLSADGKRFEPLDEMVANEQWFAWSPTNHALGYIAGNGRFALNNKRLKIQALPDWHSARVTPTDYADIAFTWHSGDRLTVSRAIESKEFVPPEQRAKPALFAVNMVDLKQNQISTPPAGFGDYQPRFIRRTQKLTWVRTNKEQASVWVANPDGSAPKEWITLLDAGTNYYEQLSWQNVLSIYGAKR